MNAKKPFLYLGLASVFAIFVVARLPVSLLGGWFLPDAIRLDGCEGTLWQGRAAAVGVNGQIVQQDLRWQFFPRHLLKGQLAWTVQGTFQQQNSQLSLQLGPTQIALQDIKLALPAGPLLAAHDRLKTLKLGGLLHVNSARLTSHQASTLEGRLENLFSPLAPNQGSLGSYRLALTLKPGLTGQWQVQPQQGALAIRGSGTLDLAQGMAGGSLAFTPQDDSLASLKPVLATLPSQNGAYTLNFSSR